MNAIEFQVIPAAGAAYPARLALKNLVVAGWAGRDMAAIEHHIEELAELGVPRPSSVPLYYRIAANQCTQDAAVQVVGTESSGEIEVFVFQHDGQWLVSIASDHTDRKLEAHSVAMSKQVCIKPVANVAWRLEDVQAHWDQIVLRSWIDEKGSRTLYQEGPLATLRTPEDLVAGYLNSLNATSWPEGTGMTCGTVGAIGGIRAANNLEMELFDPVLGRSLKWTYQVECLPDVA
ncbi:DUF2848 domain-containing protein [Lampropedia puyangensis]|uniref:DUF2848 domain-containing protein n=1 Tax=Lampropedia puyangensis TaxID=1330072 RepID=A0A4S8F7V6_9BURK|nr:DUF2848 domain-containing protein [Lampropedia puyangensis]THU03693.1 DUF2848 domain-containing protein [Lampropedia puyangensis]